MRGGVQGGLTALAACGAWDLGAAGELGLAILFGAVTGTGRVSSAWLPHELGGTATYGFGVESATEGAKYNLVSRRLETGVNELLLTTSRLVNGTWSPLAGLNTKAGHLAE